MKHLYKIIELVFLMFWNVGFFFHLVENVRTKKNKSIVTRLFNEYTFLVNTCRMIYRMGSKSKQDSTIKSLPSELWIKLRIVKWLVR